MDTQDYKKNRYDQIVTEATSFLKKSGFKKDIQFVPFSGFAGDNLAVKSSKLTWYKGPTLLEAIDKLTVP
jgi:elongation factor 1-alpha